MTLIAVGSWRGTGTTTSALLLAAAVAAGSTPGRTFKGKRMAGRMGGERVTVRDLEVVVADPARNLLAVRGAVPGHDGGLVIVRGFEGARS